MTQEKIAEPAADIALYRFGQFELDLRRFQLRREGRPLVVEAKVLQLLICLLQRPDEVLTKDELLAQVWAGRVVTEGSLTKAVMKLRAVLADERQEIVRTVHGYGYRFGAAVQRAEADALPSFTPVAGEPVPHRPNWRLLKALDEGQRGLVWLAEHTKTRERRVFKFAADPATLIALKREITLFRLLRETLGDSAPIVPLLDWNLDEPPCFSEADYFEGGDLAHWLASTDAGLEERLEAMAQLAEAVAATHAVGVVHKDLKPANVLLGRDKQGGLQLRLADFGLGTLSDSRASELLQITRLGFSRTGLGGMDDSAGGTPLYYAPELLTGQAPSQRSDLYALGVILYQAVVGDPRRALAPGWERDVDDELLRADIAAAADVDPGRRLSDASELARRLRQLPERHLQLQTERERSAQAARTTVRLHHVRQQRRWLAGLAAVLLLGLGLNFWMYRQAAEARAVSDAINHFLNEDLLARADPYLSPEPDLRLRQVLDRAAGEVEQRLSSTPAAEAGVRWALANAYAGLGEFAQSRVHLQRAASLWRIDPKHTDPRSLEYRRLNADLAFGLGETELGDSVMHALRRDLQNSPSTSRLQQVELGLAHAEHLEEARRIETAIQMFEQVDADLQEIPEAGASLRARALMGYANVLREQGRKQEARERLDRASILAATAPEDLDLLHSGISLALASLDRSEGRFDEAVVLLERVLAVREGRLRREHPDVQFAINELASALQDAGRLEEAEPLFREVLDQRLRRYGDQHVLTRNSLNNLGMLLSGRGEKLDEAEGYLRRAYQIEAELLGDAHPEVLILAHNLAGVLRRRGDLEGALALNRHAADRSREQFGSERDEPGMYLLGVAVTLGRMGRTAESRHAFDSAHAWLQVSMGAEHPRVRRVLEMRDELLGAPERM